MEADTRQPVTDDDDLDRRAKRDNYHINRIAKFAVLVLFLIAVAVITLVVLSAIIRDDKWQDYAIKSVFNALPGIVAVVLVVIGLKKR